MSASVPFTTLRAANERVTPFGRGLGPVQDAQWPTLLFQFPRVSRPGFRRDEKYPGNTFICGSTGVGKTALELRAFLAFATKYQDSAAWSSTKIAARSGIRAMGGTYQSLKRGMPTGFNPLQLEPNLNNWQFCEQLVAQLVKQPGDEIPRLTAKEQSRMGQAVRTVMSEAVSFDLRGLSSSARICRPPATRV
ncbi:MAG: hypothetical protein U0361_21970 [Nitrospiraceae bacterium]